MSLDLYIRSHHPVKHRGTGVFIRDNGQTRELKMTYANVVHRASEYIQSLGGFEKFAEWGLVRP